MKRVAIKRQIRGGSLLRDTRDNFGSMIARYKGLEWPSEEYKDDPVGFVRDKLGESPLPHQVEILEAARDNFKVAVRSGQKTGKALALPTEIPTPTGWKTMGALVEGDTVFSDTGAPCKVTYVSPILHERECFEVEFTDGSTVICDASHEWETWGSNARRNRARGLGGNPAVHTTKEISRTVDSAHRGREHAIKVAGAIECAAVPLPIEPYLFGVWLGDGNTADGYLYIAHRDADILANIRGVTKMADERGCARYRVDGLRAALCAQGLLGNKHVPPAYLRSSYADRLALLQGLLDTDGTCGARGAIEFSSSLEVLADAVFELAASLGMRPTKQSRIGKLYGVEKARNWRICFRTALPVFRTAWKRARLPRFLSADVGYRTIKAVRPVASVPVRCIQVDSPSSLFLCSRAFIPTHNTKLVVWLALWWYCTRAKARVFMIAAIKEQVQRVLWVELKATLRAGRSVGFELVETVPANPATGMTSEDGREIRGFTVRDIEAMAGLSGDILFIVDEASALLAPIAEAIEGNLAGDGKMIWISNPTRTDGPFYDVFNNPDKGKFWKTFHLSSEDVAKWCFKKNLEIPGVATLKRIAEWEEEWGRKSPFFVVRVEGNFLRNETGRIITLADIEIAQALWADMRDDEGDLTIGVDPSGPGDGGDEFAFAVVRGRKLLGMFTKPGLTEDAAVEYIRGLLVTYRRGDEIPRVVVDSEGPIGHGLYQRLKAIGEALRQKRPKDAFDTWGIKASGSARREPLLYDRLRDELWSSGARWLREGGALLPNEHKLETELHAPMWGNDLRGKLKASSKVDLRDVLGRSPDRADAFLLAVWEPTHYAHSSDGYAVEETSQGVPVRQSAGLNPYEQGLGSGGNFDPYR